jgi:hypothetical protein
VTTRKQNPTLSNIPWPIQAAAEKHLRQRLELGEEIDSYYVESCIQRCIAIWNESIEPLNEAIVKQNMNQLQIVEDQADALDNRALHAELPGVASRMQELLKPVDAKKLADSSQYFGLLGENSVYIYIYIYRTFFMTYIYIYIYMYNCFVYI